MRDRSPVPRVTVPEVAPGNLSVVVFDPFEYHDLLADVLLLIYNSARCDGTSCY